MYKSLLVRRPSHHIGDSSLIDLTIEPPYLVFSLTLIISILFFFKVLEEKLEAEVTQVDQKLVLELDQLVSDQQATLQVSKRSKT